MYKSKISEEKICAVCHGAGMIRVSDKATWNSGICLDCNGWGVYLVSKTKTRHGDVTRVHKYDMSRSVPSVA